MGFAAFLTTATNNLVDGRRGGNLFFSNKHHYSNRELVQRGFITVVTGVAGYLGWCLTNDPTSAAFGLAFGLLASHAVILPPLIYKRLKNKWTCEQLIANIKEQTTNPDLAALVNPVIEKIMQHTNKHGASATWGARKRFLTNLLGWINDTSVSVNDLTTVLNSVDVISHLGTQKLHDTGICTTHTQPRLQ